MTFTVVQGRRYKATLRLGMFEQIATNAAIADKLLAAGFADVRVWGDGRNRFAEARWPHPTRSAELPSQIKNVEALT